MTFTNSNGREIKPGENYIVVFEDETGGTLVKAIEVIVMVKVKMLDTGEEGHVPIDMLVAEQDIEFVDDEDLN